MAQKAEYEPSKISEYEIRIALDVRGKSILCEQEQLLARRPRYIMEQRDCQATPGPPSLACSIFWHQTYPVVDTDRIRGTDWPRSRTRMPECMHEHSTHIMVKAPPSSCPDLLSLLTLAPRIKFHHGKTHELQHQSVHGCNNSNLQPWLWSRKLRH